MKETINTINKVVLFKGDIETLGYFSTELSKEFIELGYEVFLFDFEKETASIKALESFLQKGKCCMVTFNFTALNGLELFRRNETTTFWDWYEVLCVNIIVDHPFYYHFGLENPPKNFILICIDRLHKKYVERFFPEIKEVYFLPSAGTEKPEDPFPFEKRPIDLIFTGNYTPPETFQQHITRINQEYTEFYYRIIEDLIAHPDLPIDEAIEEHLRQEMEEEVTEEVIRQIMPNMIFIDLYIRFYYRGKVVQTIVDSGQQIHVFGHGWEKLACRHKENLIIGGPLDSDTCLQEISKAKISLNVMPWFKDGAHDRIYNSMLNGAVCLTDPSKYLLEHLTNEKDVIYYSLGQLDRLPVMISNLLGNEKHLLQIQEHAYRTAKEAHTWGNRAKKLGEIIQNWEM